MFQFLKKGFQLKALFILSFLYSSSHAQMSCNWSVIFYDSYEYTTVIPYIIPGMTVHNTPQTFPGCVRTGSRGMYLNIIDGQIGLIYNQPFTDICVGQQYRISFSTRDAFTSVNNLTFNIKNSAGVVLSTQNVINNSIWQDITMPAFIATTSSITFEIITNLPGANGNDVGFDDLRLWQCQPVPMNFSFTDCEAGLISFDIYDSISTANLSELGVWTGVSALTNGYEGTFTPETNTNGLYTYTVSSGIGCADSVVNYTIQLLETPILNPISAVSACGSYTLPSITGSVLAGNEAYFTNAQGTGNAIPVGSVIPTTQTLYAIGGTPGCQSVEELDITIDASLFAGNDNTANYCGTGVTINLATFLSANAASGGIWSETSAIPSGTFNPTTAIFPSMGINSGSYTFSYTTPINGACLGDVANFILNFGNFPPVNLGPDTTLCPGQTITLNAAASGPYNSYLWNNNSTSSTRFVNSPGTYSVKVGTLGDNQIVNGDFEQGNTGFSTNYTLGTGGPWGLLSFEGNYAVTSSPHLAHTNFSVCQDHTPAPGTQMMVVNGSGTPGTNVWCQTIPVQANTDYQFGAWAANALNEVNVAQLQFSINGSTIGNVFSTTTNACNWQQFFQVWNSGTNNNANICIVNQNTSNGGNDFLLDDITFRPICFSYDTVVVTYSQLPQVNLGVDITLCEGETVTLDAQNSGSTFLWNDGTTDQTKVVDAAGNYQVTVTNSDFCVGTDQIIISYEDQKNAGTDGALIRCETINSVNLNLELSADATVGGTWFDANSSLNNSLSATGNLATSVYGNHTAGYVVTGTFCPNDTSYFDVTIHQQPIAAPTFIDQMCNTQGEVLDLFPFTNGETVVDSPFWTELSVINSNQFNPTAGVFDLSLLSAGTYVFGHVLPAQAPCLADTTFVEIEIIENPIIQFSSDVDRGCFPLEVQFLNESNFSPGATVNWAFSDGSTYTNLNTISHVFNSVDCFDITLTIINEGLCLSSVTNSDMICVDPLPIAVFQANPQVVFAFDPTVIFDNQSQLNTFNNWNFGDGSFSTIENPVHQFPLGEVSNYLVELIVTTDAGCKDTTSQLITVKDQLLFYSPNTFTPDGDEFNNIFRPIMESGFDPTTYELKIYNRWGQLIFFSKDILSGWDGTFNGAYVQNGIYTWTVKFKADNNDDMYTFEGHVNLMR